MKTETCKLYSRVFWTIRPNFIKIHPYNFELYRFKVGAFFWDTVYVLWNCVQEAKQKSEAAADRAADYLASKIMHVTDPFQMAILTYALQAAHHKQADTAYNRLRPMGSQHRTSMLNFC